MSGFNQFFAENSQIPPEHVQDGDELTISQHFYKPEFELHTNENRLYLEENLLPTLVPCVEKLLQLVEETFPESEIESIKNNSQTDESLKKRLITTSTESKRTPLRHDQFKPTNKDQQTVQENSESEYAKKDPLNWLAMSLMRMNLKHSNELKDHPYTKEILNHTKKVREHIGK